MKKFVFDVALGLLALAVFAMGVEYALEQSDAQDKAHFEAQIQRMEKDQKTQALLSTSDSQVLFYGLGGKLIVSPIGVEIDEAYLGTKAIGSVEFNRLTLSFNDGTSLTTYIMDGVADAMETRFVVYVQ